MTWILYDFMIPTQVTNFLKMVTWCDLGMVYEVDSGVTTGAEPQTLEFLISGRRTSGSTPSKAPSRLTTSGKSESQRYSGDMRNK
jgi:hypothetical protein